MSDTRQSDFERTVTVETCDYAVLRGEFGDWLSALGVERATVDDWRLILTELATNACEAAPPGAPITCVASCTNNRVELCVSNPTAGQPAVQPAPSFDPTLKTGGGLFIVDAIVHGIEYDIGDDFVTIRCWTPLHRG